MINIAVRPSNSSHGGMLRATGSHNTRVSGRPAAVQGDLHACPRKHHGVTVVRATGFTTINGRKVIRKYDVCGCGALIRNASNNTRSA